MLNVSFIFYLTRQDIFATVKPYGKEVYILQTGSELNEVWGRGSQEQGLVSMHEREREVCLDCSYGEIKIRHIHVCIQVKPLAILHKEPKVLQFLFALTP